MAGVSTSEPYESVAPDSGAASAARRPALDGIRGIAVLLVLVAHSFDGVLPGGVFGVDVFFVLSGYLITRILVEKRPPLREFWARRARRLFPALALVLSATAVALVFLGDGGRIREWRGDVISAFGYFANWHMLGKGVSYDELATGASPLVHVWSLAVEEQFYLFWPLLLAVPVFRSRPRVVVGVLAVLGVAATTYHLVTGAPTDRLWYGTDVRALELGAGALLATVRPLRVRQRTALVGMTVLAASSVFLWGSPLGTVAQMALVTAATMLLVSHVETMSTSTVTRSLSWRPLVWTGVVSYGLYLWHMPVLWALDRLFEFDGSTGHTLVRGAATLVISFALAAAAWVLVESRFLERSRRRNLSPRQALSTACVLLVLSAVTSLVVLTERGVYRELLNEAAAWECPDSTSVLCDFMESGRPDDWTCEEALGCVVYRPEDAEATMLVTGDSVARSLAPALVDLARVRNWEIVVLARGCGPVSLQAMSNPKHGTRPTTDPGPGTAQCPDFTEQLAASIKLHKPDVYLSVTGLAHLGYIDVDGTPVTYQESEFPAMYARGALPLADVLVRAGVPIVLFHMLEPGLPPSCTTGPQSLCDAESPPPYLQYAVEAERAALEEAYASANALFFDPRPVVCPNDVCLNVASDGFVWRYDGLHYTVPSGRRVVTQMLPVLEKALDGRN